MLSYIMEIWKEVKGYEDYEISNLGRVKSLARTIYKTDGTTQAHKERFLKPSFSNGGYLKVSLSNNFKVKTKRIHQLVAEAFLNHVPDGMNLVVDHMNAVKTDNRLDNLQIITTRENSSKDKKEGTSKYIGVCWSKLNKKWISKIRINGKREHLGYFFDELEASKAYQKALAKLVK